VLERAVFGRRPASILCPPLLTCAVASPTLPRRAQIARAVNATVIGLEDAPAAYAAFDAGAPKKYVIDPWGDVRRAHPQLAAAGKA
jgi:hypothetical protein